MNGRFEEPECVACSEVRAASDKYGRWVFIETYNDAAFIAHTLESLGLCTVHARRFVEADAMEHAGTLYEPVLQGIVKYIRAALESRALPKSLLMPKRPCPWCDREHATLAYVFHHFNGGPLCPPHTRLLNIHRMDARRLPFESPQPPAPALEGTGSNEGPKASAFSATAERVLRLLYRGCGACSDGQCAEAARIAYLCLPRRSDADLRLAQGLCVRHWSSVEPRLPGIDQATDDAGSPVRCAVCDIAWERANRFADYCAVALEEESFAAEYGRAEGLCIPHVAVALSGVVNIATMRKFLAATATRLESLAWELAEHARDRSFDLRDQPSRECAQDASLRALWILAGGLARRYDHVRWEAA